MKLLTITSFVILFAFGISFRQTVGAHSSAQGKPNQDPEKICPTVSVSCPNDPKYDEPLDFTATVRGGDPDVLPTYEWDVAGGEILAGQGTPSIKVRAFEPNSITGVVRIGGFDKSCSRTASCSTPIAAPPSKPIKIDSYGLIRSDRVRAKLDQFGNAQKRHPDAMAYILGYGRHQNREVEARRAIERAKEYLVKKFDFENDRVRTAYGGSKEEFKIELWLVPPGSALPPAEPKGDQDKTP